MSHPHNRLLLGPGGTRQLLQGQQPVGGACQCECPPLSAEHQHGVNPGWIALALFLGILVGCLSTLLVQCRRRRRELRYMNKPATTATRQSLVMMQALPAAAASAGRTTGHNAALAQQQPGTLSALPPSAPASVAGSARTAAAGAGPNHKYYSPLNSNKGHGSVVAALSELRSSLHYGSDNGGDTHSVAASDQHAPRDKGAPVASQLGGAAGDGQRTREFSQHGMRGQAQQQHSSSQGGAAGAAQAQAGLNSGGQQRHSETEVMLQGSVVYGAGGMLPQEVSSSMLSADGPLLAEDSSTLPTPHAAAPQPSKHAGAQHAAGAAGGAVAPSPRQQAQLLGSPTKGAAEGSSPGVASTTTTGSAKQVASPSGATDIEDEYEESDLDEDWKALLGGVDARLKLQGARPMNARERAIAIKKLLVATGTRGVEFALNSTLQEVLRFRQVHGDTQ